MDGDYQPLIDINSGKMICDGTLVRWKHPEMGLLEPEQFIGMEFEHSFLAKESFSVETASIGAG